MVPEAVKAAELLSERGISVAVVNARFIRPMDEKMLCVLAKRVPLIVTVEENVSKGGFGGGVVEILSQRLGSAMPRVRIIALPDRFIEHGSQKELRARCGLDAESIASCITDCLSQVEPKLKIV
jgi:1-deoxy-D-xylulose-5-phosphate synthase